ncbi:MAG: 2-oxo acid dehydrogenase subunit E2 [Magnetococcales bacterium]|nr:2-oxo acid dehydrogenase subunit E2 [Magnetococcales bacterium]
MSTEFTLPNLGENISGGDIVHVLATAGMSVTAGTVLLEVETDKAVVEVPANEDMIVQEVRIKPGDHVKVGQALFIVEPGGAKTAAPPDLSPPPVTAPPTAPPTGADQTDRAQTTTGDAATARPAGMEGSPMAVAPPVRSTVPVAAAPSVRREARELGVDIRQVKGTGPGGRIGMADVRAWVREHNRNPAAAVSQGPIGVGDARVPLHTQLPDFASWGTITREKMKNVRRATAMHMAATWNTVPQVTCHDKADITRLEELRHRFAPRIAKGGGKLSLTAIVLKVVATALKMFPQFNASVDMANDEIIFKQYIHLGVAVDTPRGLIVPVLRDVDRKNITQLAAALTILSETARAGKTALEDMRGGCFTVSNLGGIGGIGFTPIVNYPEVAILGMSKGVVEAVQVAGTFEPRLMLPLSLSFDHRLIDGADGARFLRWICEALEEPLLLSLEG